MKTTIAAIITLLGAFAASATTVTYDFSTPNNNSGSYTDTLVSNPTGYSITESGSQSNPSLIILNITSLASASALDLELDGVGRGDSFTVSGLTSSTYNPGSATVLFAGGSANDDAYFSVPNFTNYSYLAISTSGGNQTLEGVEATFAVKSISNAVAVTPEPASMGFVGLALVGVALVGKLRKKTS
jgi:hypothetical protein